jgi:hypothetical protein
MRISGGSHAHAETAIMQLIVINFASTQPGVTSTISPLLLVWFEIADTKQVSHG